MLIDRPKKILILGSGALKIGEAGEFDYSGSQALKAFKEEGIKTVLLNPNIATIQTDHHLADTVYLLPVTPQFVEKVIQKEKPDAIALSFGGQTALNCGLELWKMGIFDQYNIRVLGTPLETILDTEDRERFTDRLCEVQASYAHSIAASSTQEAIDAANTIGYPLMVRIAYALGGLGSGVCRNKKELIERSEQAFAHTSQILLEEYLEGWKEVEYEVVRDRYDNCITVCNMENFDPMGIHTGESIVVAPSQTLSNRDYHLLRSVSIRVIRHLGVVGECNIQFAYHPHKEAYRIIEVNARLSRSSALASKATGYPLAFVAAKLSLGYGLHEIPNKITQTTTSMFEPALDYVVVKIPRWDLQKFHHVSKQLGSGMKSVGEIMAIGTSFEEALQKGLRMLHIGAHGLTGNQFPLPEDLDDALKHATDRRVFDIVEAFHRGYTVEQIHSKTFINSWFLSNIERVVSLNQQIKSCTNIDKILMRTLKRAGFSDKQIAVSRGGSEKEMRNLRIEHGVHPILRQIDTLAAEFPAQTNYLYLSYAGTKSDVVQPHGQSTLILGSGSYRIGSSVEFDWCCVTAAQTLRRLGHSTIMLNHNPETVSTDYDESEMLIFDEISIESITEINRLLHPSSVLLSVGGQIANNLALDLKREDINILGTRADCIDMAENRHSFSSMLDKLDIDQPQWEELHSLEEATAFAGTVGYPVLVRPSYVLSGAAMTVVPRSELLESYLSKASQISNDRPVVISRFILGAREVELDGVARNGNLQSFALSEHLENAGVHSGDATMVLPCMHISQKEKESIQHIAQKIAHTLEIHGPFNIQFLVKDGFVKVIECNLRASRSFPFVSKVLGHNLIEEAIHIMLNKEHKHLSTNEPLRYIGVKAPQFSFARLRGADPCLGVEMSSTGEVGCLGYSVHEALLKAMHAVGYPLQISTALLSTGNLQEKQALLSMARLLFASEVKLYATPGTASFLKENHIPSTLVHWPLDNHDSSAIKIIEQKKVDLVINIPKNHQKDELTNGYLIRRSAVDFNIPLLTNAQLAHHYVEAMCTTDVHSLPAVALQEYTT